MNPAEKTSMSELVEDALDHMDAVVSNLTVLEGFFISKFGDKAIETGTLRSLLRQAQELANRAPKVFSVVSDLTEAIQAPPEIMSKAKLDTATVDKYIKSPEMSKLDQTPNPFKK